MHYETWRSYSTNVARFHRWLYRNQKFVKHSNINPGKTLRFNRKDNKSIFVSYRVRLIFSLPFTLNIYYRDICYLTLASKLVTPQLESRTSFNCRVSLNKTKFPRTPPKDPKGTTDKHCPFEIKTFKCIYDHINKNYLKIENSTKILTEFLLKNRLKPL